MKATLGGLRLLLAIVIMQACDSRTGLIGAWKEHTGPLDEWSLEIEFLDNGGYRMMYVPLADSVLCATPLIHAGQIDTSDGKTLRLYDHPGNLQGQWSFELQGETLVLTNDDGRHVLNRVDRFILDN